MPKDNVSTVPEIRSVVVNLNVNVMILFGGRLNKLAPETKMAVAMGPSY